MRLIDADALIPGKLLAVNIKNPIETVEYLMNRINKAPTIDAVPVVRCEKCTHNNERLALRDGGVWCEYWGTDPDGDGFCYKGEGR